MKIDLDDLEAVARAATPGPWTYKPTILGLPNTTVMAGDDQLGYIGVGHFLAPNATHIAAFDPPTVLALVAELRVLRESNSAEGRAIARSTVHAADALGGLRLYLGAEMVKLGYAGLRAKLREAEAVIAEALELIATVKVAGEVPVDVFAIERILARSKPTNKEGNTER